MSSNKKPQPEQKIEYTTATMLVLSDGSTYIGEEKDGVPNGDGTKWLNGDEFKGFL